jgi:HK97 family phage major capsid protein
VSEEIRDLIIEQGRAWEEFKKANDHRLGNLEEGLREQAKQLGRARATGSIGGGERIVQPAPRGWIDAKTGNILPVLEHKDRLADHVAAPSFDSFDRIDRKSLPSFGRILRGLVLGGRAPDAAELAEERKALSINVDPSGGYTVAGQVAAQWIDALRAQMVLSRAGVTTIPMESKSLTVARVDSDPAVSWHAENADITATDPSFGAATLNAKTVVCLVKLSLELAQDSVNIEQQLSDVLTRALANAIDSAGLVGVSTNAAAAPVGIFDTAGNSVTGIGAPSNWDWLTDGIYELLADDVPADRIGALIAHPAVWKTMVQLKTGISSDESPLPMPEEVRNVPKLWTTAAPLTGSTAKGVIGDWSDLLFGVRSQIAVRVLSEVFMGSNLQLAVLAYARVDFQPARVNSFCTLEGLSV